MKQNASNYFYETRKTINKFVYTQIRFDCKHKQFKDITTYY